MRNLYPLTADGNYEIPRTTSPKVDRNGTTGISDALIATAKSGGSLSSREDDIKYIYFSQEPVYNSGVLMIRYSIG